MISNWKIKCAMTWVRPVPLQLCAHKLILLSRFNNFFQWLTNHHPFKLIMQLIARSALSNGHLQQRVRMIGDLRGWLRDSSKWLGGWEGQTINSGWPTSESWGNQECWARYELCGQVQHPQERNLARLSKGQRLAISPPKTLFLTLKTMWILLFPMLMNFKAIPLRPQV